MAQTQLIRLIRLLSYAAESDAMRVDGQQDSLDGLGVESLVFKKLKAQHQNFDEFLILLN